MIYLINRRVRPRRDVHGGRGLEADGRVGVGGGSDAHWWQDDGDEARGRAREIVHMCLKAGVNLIDTSHWYGQGRSERLLGHALSDVPRAAYYITTKIGRYEKDALGMFDFSYEKTYQAALDSLKRLRLDCVDSMQIHDPEFCPSVDLLLEQTLPALQKLRRRRGRCASSA